MSLAPQSPNSRLLKSVMTMSARDVTISMQKALDDGADINNQDAVGATALMLACYMSNHNAVQFLIDNGADPHVKNEQGDTALHMALSCFQAPEKAITCMKIIVKAGGLVNEKNEEGVSPFLLAIKTAGMTRSINDPSEMSDLLIFMIENGADLITPALEFKRKNRPSLFKSPAHIIVKENKKAPPFKRDLVNMAQSALDKRAILDKMPPPSNTPYRPVKI